MLTVDVAEAAGFAFLCMMQSACPVHRNVTFLAVQSGCTLHAATGTDTAEFEETVEHRAIVTNVVFPLLPHVAVHVVGRDLLQEIDVVVRVKLCHFASGSWFCALKSSVLAE